jgi:hypothetical protein
VAVAEHAAAAEVVADAEEAEAVVGGADKIRFSMGH